MDSIGSSRLFGTEPVLVAYPDNLRRPGSGIDVDPPLAVVGRRGNDPGPSGLMRCRRHDRFTAGIGQRIVGGDRRGVGGWNAFRLARGRQSVVHDYI